MDFTTTRLLTLLNVSATKASKRKWTEDSVSSEKLNKRKSARIAATDDILADDADTMLKNGSETSNDEAAALEGDTPAEVPEVGDDDEGKPMVFPLFALN